MRRRRRLLKGPVMRILDDVRAWLVRCATNRALARIRERHGMAVYQESLAALESAAAGRSEAPSPVAAQTIVIQPVRSLT